MGICWYCYWGWAKPVMDIYQEALRRLDGDDGPLQFGPSHIVWADENFRDHHIQSCLEYADEPGHDLSDVDMEIVKWSLEELLKIPENVRCCQPEDYDEEHPEKFPPEVETVKL